MAQLFSPRADWRLRLGMALLAIAMAGGAVVLFAWSRSDAAWRVGEPAPQPIPFSHAIHAGGLGLDCRYCHSDAVRPASAGAGMPAGELCLGCHQQVWNVQAQFAPVIAALEGPATVWSSVHRLPDHVRFHHGAHAAAGVPCAACHGAVEAMPRTVKTETLSMGWCLDCHRDPLRQGYVPVNAGRFQQVHAGLEVQALMRCTVCHQ